MPGVAAVGTRAKALPPNLARMGDTVLCRQCREPIARGAKKCKHCGSRTAVTSVAQVLGAFFLILLVVIVVAAWINAMT